MRIAPFLGQLAREIYVIDLVNTQSRKITRHTKNPPQGLSEVWGAGSFFLHFSYRSAAQESVSGVVVCIVTNRLCGNNPRIISEYYDFHRNCLLQVLSRRCSLSPSKKR
jgi:hypothetical protein